MNKPIDPREVKNVAKLIATKTVLVYVVRILGRRVPGFEQELRDLFADRSARLLESAGRQFGHLGPEMADALGGELEEAFDELLAQIFAPPP